MSGMNPNVGLPSDHHRTWILLTVVISLLFIVALVFGIWAYGSRQDFKNNTDKKIAVAVNNAVNNTQATDKTNNDAANELPLKPYIGPSSYGSVTVYYPKTWSAYLIDTSNSGDNGSGNPVDGYFQPDIVPNVGNSKNDFALRVQVLQQAYDQTLQGYQSQAKSGSVTITPFVPAKVPSITGVRVDGLIQDGKRGSMVIVPIRANTLLLWTEAAQYESDFNNNILPNFSFNP